MAMDKTQLAQEIRAALEAVTGQSLPGSPDSYLEAFTEALISHIVDNAVTQVKVDANQDGTDETYEGQIIE